MLFLKSKIYECKIFNKEKEIFELERCFLKNYRKSLFYFISVKMREFNRKMLECVPNVIEDEQKFRSLLCYLSYISEQKDLKDYMTIKGIVSFPDVNISDVISDYIQYKLPFVVDIRYYDTDFDVIAGKTRNLGVIHYLISVKYSQFYRNFCMKGILLEGHGDILKYFINKGWDNFRSFEVQRYLINSKNKDLFFKVLNKLDKNSVLYTACNDNNLEFIKILSNFTKITDDHLGSVTDLEVFRYVENEIEGKIDYNKVFMDVPKTDEKMIRYFLVKGCTEYEQMLKNSLKNNHMKLALEIYNKKQDWFDLLRRTLTILGELTTIRYYGYEDKELAIKIKNFLISQRGNRL